MLNSDVAVYGTDLPNKLSDKEFLYYYRLSKNGNINARNKIIEHNLRLVYKTVLKISSLYSIINDDLISIGTIGLINAVDTYDINKNYSFSTYATICITHIIRSYYTDSKNKVKFLLTINNKRIIDDDAKTTIQDIIDPSSENFLEKFITNDYLEYLLEILSDRDRDIIEMSFGLGKYNKVYKEKEISQKHKITHQEVSRIKLDRLKKLKKAAEDIQYRNSEILRKKKKLS